MTASVLKLDKDQLKFLLKNHECFSNNEVKIAAKRLAQWVDYSETNNARLRAIAATQNIERRMNISSPITPTKINNKRWPNG